MYAADRSSHIPDPVLDDPVLIRYLFPSRKP